MSDFKPRPRQTKGHRYTIIIAGKAGEGIKKAAQVIAQILDRRSRYVFQTDDYQSLIKGGHNFSVVSSDTEPIYSAYSDADILICFDQKSMDQHASSLAPDALLFHNSDDGTSDFGYGLPLTTTMKHVFGKSGNISVSAVAIACAVLGISADETQSIVRQNYRRDSETNAQYAKAIHDLIKIPAIDLPTAHNKPSHTLLSGNQLIALGAYSAGLDFYYGYPMTPASSILHYLAAMRDKLGVYAIHAESEVAVINMAIGTAFTGCRVAVGSSGGGVALMQEGFSLCGMAEVPMLFILSSRPGPATGVSTYTAQEDLFFALHQGHGEFPRIVAAPDGFERAFILAHELMKLAWQTQSPCILLTEKHLSESSAGVELPSDIKINPEASPELQRDDYKRYRITENGVSPLAFPPAIHSIKWNSHEHLESGLRTDRMDAMIAIKDKRERKYLTIEQAVKNHQRIAVYGHGTPLVLCYGSTTLELREAAKHLDQKVSIIALIYLEPFPADLLAEYDGQNAIIVEHNSHGSLGLLLEEKTRLNIIGDIRKYDGRPFEPKDLARRLQEVIDATS